MSCDLSISVTHTHTHVIIIYTCIVYRLSLSFSARVFSVTGGCGFSDCRRSFRLLVFPVFIWTFIFASCCPLCLVAVVTGRVLKDDVIRIGWVWQKLLSWTHLSKELTSLRKKERQQKSCCNLLNFFELGLWILLTPYGKLQPKYQHYSWKRFIDMWCYLISSFFVSDGGVGFRGQIEPVWSRLVGVVNTV